jgi:hypothetical protein
MPFRLASLEYEKFLQVIQKNTAEKWVLGGHSLGAAKAAQFVYQHTDDQLATLNRDLTIGV